jgi:hypothetical protein
MLRQFAWGSTHAMCKLPWNAAREDDNLLPREQTEIFTYLNKELSTKSKVIGA